MGLSFMPTTTALATTATAMVWEDSVDTQDTVDTVWDMLDTVLEPMASMLDTMASMASPLESKVLPVSMPLTFPFPVPDANVVMLTPRLRLKPRLLPTTMEVTTAVMPDTLTTDTDTVWAVITDMDSIPV